MADVTEDVCAVVKKELIEKILKDDYGFVGGHIRQLDGYDDKNFHITKVNKCIEEIEFPVDGIMMKFINSIDAKNLSLLDAQTELTQYLNNSGICCPTPVLNKYKQYFRQIIIDNKMHAVRVYKYIAGETMKSTKVDSKVSTDFGSYVGNLSLTLKKFDHEGFHRESHMWSVENSPEVLKFVDVFDEEKQRQTIIKVLNKFQSDVLCRADHFEKSVIHGDLSFNNIILKDNKIIGIIDMGDVVHTYSIFEFTVALCYLILHEFEDDNGKLTNVQIRSFVDAYEKQYKTLNDLELSIVHTCVCARICQSLVLGKKSSLRDLTNSYILSTQKNGWRALEELTSISEDEFIKLFKH